MADSHHLKKSKNGHISPTGIRKGKEGEGEKTMENCRAGETGKVEGWEGKTGKG